MTAQTRPLADDLCESLAAAVGAPQPARLTQQQAILQALIQNAIGGDTRAAHILIRLKLAADEQQAAPRSAAPGVAPDSGAVDADDAAVLEAFTQQVLRADKPGHRQEHSRSADDSQRGTSAPARPEHNDSGTSLPKRLTSPQGEAAGFNGTAPRPMMASHRFEPGGVLSLDGGAWWEDGPQ